MNTLSSRDAGWLAAAAISGSAWGLLLAWLESAGPSLLFLVGGAVGGLVLSLLIRPYCQADDRAGLVLLSLLLVYAAGAYSGALTGLRDLMTGGLDGATALVVTPVGEAFVACWALTLSGVFLVLWPLAAANIAGVWRLQRRAAAYSPGL